MAVFNLILDEKAGADYKGQFHDGLGITSERVEELGRECGVIFKLKKDAEGNRVTLAQKMAKVTELCNTVNELVWASFIFGLNVAQAEKPRSIMTDLKEILTAKG